jgi:DNA-binding CsgD family transcriptional regulator
MAAQVSSRVPSRVARLVDEVCADAGAPVQLGIVAPGGAGAGEVLDALVARLRSHGAAPLRLSGRRLEQDQPFAALSDLGESDGGPRAGSEPDRQAERQWRDLLLAKLGAGNGQSVLVVDEAQWLDEASLRVVVGVAERAAERDLSVIAAHRPAPRDTLLATLDAALSRGRSLVWLGPLDEADVAERAALLLGRGVDPALVDALHERSAGMQAFVDQLAQAWSTDSGRSRPDPSDSSGGGGRELTAAVVEAVRAEVDQLPEATRTVLEALSAGADLDGDLLGTVTGQSADDLDDALDALRAAGLVVPGTDVVVPVVQSAVDQLTAIADRRRFHAQLAAALVERGAPPTQAAEHLAAAEARGDDAATTFVAAGDATLADAPELARTWYDRAAAAGAPPAMLAARRAEAAALDGDAAQALRLADAAASDPTNPEADRSKAVMAALLPARGYWRRAAGAYGEIAPALAGYGPAAGTLSRLSALVGGRPPGARTAKDDVPGAGTLELQALELTAEGLRRSLALDETAADALAPVLEAAELYESANARLLLPDSPHAIGATIALALSELTAAEHLMTRAIEHDIGGRSLRPRHQLLLGWVAVRTGRWSTAQTALDQVRDQQLAPREVLLASAVDAGLARRAGDLARLGDAWRRAEGVLLRHPADLLSLDAVGELAITASRLGLWERIAGKAREYGDVLRALDEPPLWQLPLRWIGLQVALAPDDHDAVRRRAAEVEAAPAVHPRLGALGEAARTWVAVLDGIVEPTQVAAASRALQGIGLVWEASRLTGQAAIRSGDPSMTRALLEQARDLKAALPSAEADQTPTTASVLSEREQMVAQYIVDGLTYKEIGAQLYISPKTVEHHVAKIRQKLGASTRAEMLAALRSQLGS